MEDVTLRRLGARVAGILEVGPGTGIDAATARERDPGKGVRRWMIAEALLAAAAGLAVAYGVWRAFAT